MVPHETGVPLPIGCVYREIGLQSIGDVVRIPELTELGI